MSTQINRLGEPNLNLTVVPGRNGELTVELSIPRSSGSLQNIPFLEVTRNEREHLLNAAQQELIGRLSRSGLRVEQIDFNMQQGTEASIGGNVRLGKFTIGVTDQRGVDVSISNNPNVRDAINGAERRFDEDRNRIYQERAREWADQGGATLTSNGRTYQVTGQAAADFYNAHRWFPWEKISPRADAGDGNLQVASADNPLANNARFAQIANGLQALNTPNEKLPDMAATIYQTATDSNFKLDDKAPPLQVANSTRGDGVVLTQGDSVSAANALIRNADVRDGAYHQLVAQLAQPPQTTQQNTPVIALEQPQQERRSPTLSV